MALQPPYTYPGETSGGGGGSGTDFTWLDPLDLSALQVSDTVPLVSGLPSGLSQVRFAYDNFKLSGTNEPRLQLGISSGFVESGYSGYADRSGATGNPTAHVSGFWFFTLQASGSNTYSATARIVRMNGNRWNYYLDGGLVNTAANGMTARGTVDLGAELEDLRLLINGSNTVSSGKLRIGYQ